VNEMIDISVLIEDFLDDAAGHLQSIEASLLELEKRWLEGTYDQAVVTLLLGSLHTLKGNSGMMGFTAIQQYVHKLESAFKQIQERLVPLSATVFECFYAAVSALRASLTQLAVDPAARLDFSDELMALDCIFFNELVNEDDQQTGEASPQIKGKSDDLSFVTQKSATLKVSFEKLDELLNLVGELVIHRTALTTLETRFREKVADRELMEAFSEASLLIGKSSADLREAIMKARMLPIKSVFQRFQRLVRDHSRRSGKEIILKFEGEETELDKTVIDEIGEPLLHLIRNAIDHGVEDKEERRLTGKEHAGTVTLKASHEGNHIVISVADDGRGIDQARVRSSAVGKGLISPEEAEGLSEQESLQLLFLPGFSTSETVTETSGRGIGLDVVKNIATALNGLVEISARPGAGTVFTIKLPLTLAIITALMVEVAEETFAIPLSGVLESIKVRSSEIHEVGGGEVVNLRERLLPVHRLDRYFGRQSAAGREHEYIVVVGSGEKRGGLVVDRLIGQQEVVIKALDDYLGELPGISGGTVLGDGSISMILDIGSILLSASAVNKARMTAAGAERSFQS